MTVYAFPSGLPPQGDPDDLPPTRDEVEAAYVASEDFTADALEWLTDHAQEFADIVWLAEQRYRESSEFATRVDDRLDGEL